MTQKLAICGALWFACLVTTVYAAADHTHTDIAVDINRIADPLLNSGSLVIAALLLLIAILLVANVVLYRDNRANNKDNQDMALRTLQVLSDIDKTIQANTNARARHGA
jgi:hypothetical protein